MVTITSTCGGKTEPWSLKLTGCGVLLSVCFYYPESPAGTFKQGVPERDRQRERDTGVSRPTCWFYYSQIQLHHNKQEAQMFLPWTTREIWQSVRGQFTRWKLLSGAWSHKSSTSWMENDPYSEFSRDLHRAAGLTSWIETVGMKPVIGAFLPKLLKHSPVHLFTDGTDINKLAAVSFLIVWIQTVIMSHTHALTWNWITFIFPSCDFS